MGRNEFYSYELLGIERIGNENKLFFRLYTSFCDHLSSWSGQIDTLSFFLVKDILSLPHLIVLFTFYQKIY